MGIVNDHHYLRVKLNVANKEKDEEDSHYVIIDPILKSKRNPSGVFYSEKDHKRVISNFNSLGLKGIFKQIRRLVRLKN